MPRDSGPTREKLLDAALKLWAVRGLEGTTLADINEAADQRNTSAIQYHFEGRDGLIAAIYERYLPPLYLRHQELLKRAERSKRVRPVAESILFPLGELLTGNWRDRAFLELFAQMFGGSRLTDSQWADLLPPGFLRANGEEAFSRAETLLLERIPPLPAPLALMRLGVVSGIAAQELADFARRWDARGRRPEDPDLFVSNLVDMFIAALTAPISASTSAVLATMEKGAGLDKKPARRSRPARGVARH